MAAGQFGDTTFTKVFVGGLAWETQKDTMSKYFEQFGEILEAVVITDKATGRSKGYGFVTFREPDAAMRACVDPAPVIDGRRANCNLAYLGVQKSKPTTPSQGGKGFKVMKSFPTAGGHHVGLGAAFPSAATAATYPHYAIQQGIPYNLYGYSQYSPDYAYPTSYYNVYGGAAAAQYPMYAGAPGMVSGANSAFYPYYQLGLAGAATGDSYAQGQGYGIQYPSMFPYSTVTTSGGLTGFAPQGPPQYCAAGAIPFAAPASPPAQAGMTMALTSPLISPVARSFRLMSAHFTPPVASEQPLA